MSKFKQKFRSEQGLGEVILKIYKILRHMKSCGIYEVLNIDKYSYL